MIIFTLYTGSKPHKELELIVKGKILVKDIGKLSNGEQTSSVEAFHKIVIFFAPKSVHFGFAAMEARYAQFCPPYLTI